MKLAYGLPLTVSLFWCALFQLQPTYQSVHAEPAGYMALRTTTTDGLSDYDNPNKGSSSGHGYDVPKGASVGYQTPTNQMTRHNPGKMCLWFSKRDSTLYLAKSYGYSISDLKTT